MTTMRVCASITIPEVKQLRRLEPILKLLENVPVELNLTRLVKSPDFDKFIPLLAVELEDHFSDNVNYIRVITQPQEGLIERLLALIDYLNVERLVLKPPEDVETMYNIVDEAAKYGVKVVWKFRKIESVDQLHEIANELTPYRLRIAVDVASRKSTKDFTKFMVSASGYVYATYMYNKSGQERGIPIFDDKGKINYVKVLKIMSCIRYEGDLILSYRPEYYGRYRSDIDMTYMILQSAGGQAVDSKTKKLIERVIQEIVSGQS